jgi:uncharacterized protein (TIGR00251 family)
MTVLSIIDITVIPKSSQKKIIVENDDTIRVYLNSPPADGKANKECIASIAKALGIPKSAVSIERGSKSRKKQLAINNLTKDEIIDRLMNRKK